MNSYTTPEMTLYVLASKNEIEEDEEVEYILFRSSVFAYYTFMTNVFANRNDTAIYI